ncbi:MAG TPA: CRTAC1 family protein [Pirellulales bacterium]|nr:CRTAC1 family protein [Pirellulales bacterium]
MDPASSVRHVVWVALAALPCSLAACSKQRGGPSTIESAAPLVPEAGPRATGRVVNAEDHELRFTDITAQSGVEVVYRNQRDDPYPSILESLGGGAGVFDYDGDGRLDLFFPGGGRWGAGQVTGLPSLCFRQTGALTFGDVSTATRLEESPYYSHGCAVGDADNDGFADLLLTGYGGLRLFHNQGDGTFDEISQTAGLLDDLWSTAAGWGDLNGDGCLDLYVAHYVDWSLSNNPPCERPPPENIDICSPKKFEPLPDAVFYGNGDGTFRRADSEAGLRPDGKGLGVILTDIDLDGDLDIYVANDTVENFLYLNDGHGRLEEVGGLCGVACGEYGEMEGSMGVAAGDFDGDLLPDLWVANYEDETFSLYRNQGEAMFVHVSQMSGVAALGRLYVGFGTGFVDLDHDGDLDLVVANGHVLNAPRAAAVKQLPLALINDTSATNGGRSFHRVAFSSGYFATTHRGRGFAAADLDEDGDLDFVFTHNDDEPAAIIKDRGQDSGVGGQGTKRVEGSGFRVQARDRESGVGGQGAATSDEPLRGPWLRVRLIGTTSNRDGVGATLRLRSTSGERLRQINGGGSYLSQSDLRPLWSLPPGDVLEQLTVIWPSGATTEVNNLKANATLILVEERVQGSGFRVQHFREPPIGLNGPQSGKEIVDPNG